MKNLPFSSVPPWVAADRVDDVVGLAEWLLTILLGPVDRSPGQGSIYAALVERRNKCRPDSGDWRALAPQPEVNSLLGRMVSILQGKAIDSDELGFSTAVDRAMLQHLNRTPALAGRADALRQISADAETEMERYFSDRWLRHLNGLDGLRPAPESLAEIMADFPYYDGYRELVAAEAALLATPRRIIFGGGGPLPISGLLLASITGAEVVVVDADAETAARSSQLIRAMEGRRLIPVGQVEVCHADVADMSLAEPCSGIVVASLVGPDAKIRLAQRLSGELTSPPPLILRSAIGMCARLAYRPAPRAAVVASGLKFCGELVPANHIIKGLDPSLGQRFDVRSDLGERLLGVLSASVLNSTEIYQA